jgi:hypothetical protein
MKARTTITLPLGVTLGSDVEARIATSHRRGKCDITLYSVDKGMTSIGVEIEIDVEIEALLSSVGVVSIGLKDRPQINTH